MGLELRVFLVNSKLCSFGSLDLSLLLQFVVDIDLLSGFFGFLGYARAPPLPHLLSILLSVALSFELAGFSYIGPSDVRVVNLSFRNLL